MNIIMLLTNAFDLDVRVYKEAVYLVKKGHHVTILCWDRNAKTTLPQKEKRDGIRVIRFRIPSILGTGYRQIGAYLKYVCACRKYLSRHKADYIHCHDLDGMMAYRLTGMRKIPYVFDMHELYNRGNRMRRTVSRKIVEKGIKNSYCSIAVLPVQSLNVSESLAEKIVLLKNYPDSSYIRYSEKIQSSVLRIGYHGAVRRQIPYFEALFEACKGLEDVRIDINGGGIDLPALKEMEKHYDNVYVHGKYDGIAETNRLYQNTDLLFCGYNPDDQQYRQKDLEAVKFYEAIVTGTPMIMTEGISMGDKVKKFGFGFVVNPNDSKAIRDIVLKVRDNRQLLKECADRMLDKADDYKWETAVQVLDQIYG